MSSNLPTTKWKRLLRDGLVLLGFCGTFLLFLAIVAKLDGNSEKAPVDFSQNRLLADSLTEQKDWQAALANLESLIAKDPRDGRAQFEYARIYYKQRGIAIERLTEFVEDEKESPEYQAALDDIAKYSGLAKAELLKSREHARYRGRSLLWLAVVTCSDGDLEESINFLEEFVDTGNYTPDRLDQYRVFGNGGPAMTSPGIEKTAEVGLHSYPKFWEVIRKENANRKSY